MSETLINRDFGLFDKFKIDCKNCCGLCCTALFCSKTDGFPADKEAGIPCRNLMSDFRCNVHTMLAKQKLKGCITYDCLGAGQIVTQDIFNGVTWKESSDNAIQQFDVFMIVYELQLMHWYLLEAGMITLKTSLLDEITLLVQENNKMKRLSPQEILTADIATYKTKVNKVLKKIGELVQLQVTGKIAEKHSTNYLGKNLKGINLKGKDFSMSLLIAANLEGCDLFGVNFIGADMRDANIRNADLSQSIFLTQMQVNSAKGNRATKLPESLLYPLSWDS